ncbi:MAG TPA: GNAT family N-acetyltransferase [Burkholderiaceae bacterium]|jgi:GNAT superfamily N-acetyltransferase
MIVDEVLKHFDHEVRTHPIARAGLRVERFDKVICLTGIYNYVSSWDFPPGEANTAVAQVAGHFRSRGEELLWRLYEHDGQRDRTDVISVALSAQGFVAEPSGMFMLADTSASLQIPRSETFEVRQVASAAAVDDFLAATDQAFGERHTDRQRAAYQDELGNPDHLLFVVYVGDIPVASSRMEIAGSFGQLYGGGVIPAWRGRGIYRAMVAARRQAAQERSLRYLSTEAADSSRPILESLGFVAAGRETTWILHRP